VQPVSRIGPVEPPGEVIEKSGRLDTTAKAEVKDEEAKKWTEILESLSPEDFGKYKM